MRITERTQKMGGTRGEAGLTNQNQTAGPRLARTAQGRVTVMACITS